MGPATGSARRVTSPELEAWPLASQVSYRGCQHIQPPMHPLTSSMAMHSLTCMWPSHASTHLFHGYALFDLHVALPCIIHSPPPCLCTL